MNLVVPANDGWAFQNYVGANRCAGPDDDAPPDRCEWTDANRISEFGTRVYNRACINQASLFFAFVR